MVFIVLFDAWKVIAKGSESPKSFWDVASAIGTCAAVLVALWLGVRQERIRRSESLVRARLVAARVTPRLSLTLDAVNLLSAHMRRYDDSDVKTGDQLVRMQNSAFMAVFDMPIDDLTALSPLPNHCALRLARAMALMEMTKAEVDEWSTQFWTQETNARSRTLHAKRWTNWANEAAALLELALFECTNASRGILAPPTPDEPLCY
jgi:hypothetical protein